MIKSMNISWWVQRWSELYPQKVAIIFEGEEITYLDLHRRANRTACWLQSLGIEKGDRVAVMLENIPQFIEIYLACARLGAIFVPINYRLAPPELEYILGNSMPRLFIFGRDFQETVQPLELLYRRPPILMAMVEAGKIDGEIISYDREVVDFNDKAPFLTKSLGPADPEEPQVIMYTSGTTGDPKGAVLSHRKTFFNCLNAEIFFNLSFDDVMLIVLPLFHSGGLFIQASPTIYKGATMVLHRRFDPEKVFEDVKRYRVTKFLGVPTIYKTLSGAKNKKKESFSSLKICAIGGEKATYELLKKLREEGFPLRQIMGQTETSILLWASEEDVINRPGTVGRPVFHAEVAIVDENGRRLGPGKIGELVVRGSIMMKEYWRDPVRTEETIRDGWLYTGDLAMMDEDGYFYLVDRVKDMYISGGENVYPAEVEKVLRSHPDVEDVAVVGIPDDRWGETGCAFIIKKRDCKLTEREIKEFCKGRLARFKWPKRVVFCESFPKTALGKIRKSLLREQFLKKLNQDTR